MMYRKAPVRSSMFSVTTFMTTEMIQKTFIALDIVKRYYDRHMENGDIVRDMTVEGYGEMVSFREVVLGAWLVFDKVFGPYPNMDVPFFERKQRIGWLGPTVNPKFDIPIALQIYDECRDKNRFGTDSILSDNVYHKWFVKMDGYFYYIDSYHALKGMNEPFYDWLMAQVEQAKILLGPDYNDDIDTGIVPYIFDRLPEPTDFDGSYDRDQYLLENPSAADDNLFKAGLSVNKNEMKEMDYSFDALPRSPMYDSKYILDGMIGDLSRNKSLIFSIELYCKLLTSLEQVMYKFTKKIFPIKIYGIITSIYLTYVKNIASYVKPYHATMLEQNPVFDIGEDSVVVSDNTFTTINQQIMDNVFCHVFDGDTEPIWYDGINFIRDYVEISVYENENMKPFLFDDVPVAENYDEYFDITLI